MNTACSTSAPGAVDRGSLECMASYRTMDDCYDALTDCFADTVCSDTCIYAFDGTCDDGGSGSEYDVCAYGTDCSDCGAR